MKKSKGAPTLLELIEYLKAWTRKKITGQVVIVLNDGGIRDVKLTQSVK